MTISKPVHTLAAAFLIAAGISCSRSPAYELGLYHWRTTVEYDTQDRAFFRSHNITRMYVRFFDVTYNRQRGETVPTAPAHIRRPYDPGCETVPVVFITQDAISHCTTNNVDALAGKIISRIRLMADEIGIASSVNELQLDCDWTRGTKDSYFALISAIQRHTARVFPGTAVSSTIRLHQIKYAESLGIPPADSGMLMIYNVRSPHDFAASNAIYNQPDAMRYLMYLPDYPLRLDYALPLYSQGRQFNAHTNFIRLINGLTDDDIDTNQFTRIGAHRYAASTDSYIDSRRVMRGDFIIIDDTDLAAVRRIIPLITRYGRNARDGVAKTHVVLYHYEPSIRERFSHEKLFGSDSFRHR
ncbi:MAG: hypothetical protein HZC28_20370 [Spirochaetes bacterium]|nr:hypothetical protein [Spirochaetota bacterium]